MNKISTTETTLKSIRSMCTERDRKDRERLRSNRLDMDRRDEAERERLQNTSSILNSYINVRKIENSNNLRNMKKFGKIWKFDYGCGMIINMVNNILISKIIDLWKDE